MTRRRYIPARPSRSTRHHIHPPALQCPDGWPDGAAIRSLVDLDALVAAVAEQVTADNVYHLMQRIPSGFRQLMLREIGLQQASSINRGMAGMVLARIRGDRSPADSQLLSMLTQPVLKLLDLPLDATQWSDLIGDDPHRAAQTLDARPYLVGTLATVTGMAAPLRTAALASAIAHNAAASAVALALLAVDDPACAEAHEQLAGRFPQLPPVPARDLTDLLRAAQDRVSDPEGPEEEVAMDDSQESHEVTHVFGLEPDTEGDPTSAFGTDADDGLRALALPLSPGHDADVGVIADVVARVTEVWADMVEHAEAVVDALRLGMLPDDVHLAALAGFGPLVRLAADRCGDLLDQDVDAVRDELAAAAEDLRDRALPRPELMDLTGLQAPPAVEAAAEAARELARRAVEPPPAGAGAGDDVDVEALRALHTLITGARDRRVGYPVDEAVLVAADQLVRDRLPSVAPLLVPILLGSVTLPESPQMELPLWDTTDLDGPDAPDTPDVAGAAPQPLPKAGTAKEVTATTAQVTSVTATESPDTRPAGVHDGHLIPTRTAARDLGAETGPASEPATPPLATGADEEAALASLLAGARDSLSALARRRPEQPPAERVPEAGPAQRPAAAATGVPPAQAAPSGFVTDRRAAAVTDRGRQVGPHATTVPTERQNTTATHEHGGHEPGAAKRGANERGAVIKAREAQAALLAAGRFGLAADLLEAAGAAEASVAARRGVAYATALRYPTGALASAFSAVATTLTRDSLADDRSGQLLAWAAAARLCLLSPSAGPATVLSDLAPVVTGSDALTEVGAALIEASRAGVVVLPETADAVGSLAAHEAQAEAVASQAADLLGGAANRPLKYVPANAVYQFWMNPTGPLGELLTMVAANDAAQLGAVRDRIVKLRGNAERLIEETRADVRKRHHREKKIVAGARDNLTTRYNDVIDLASRWTEAAERAEQAAVEARNDAWQTPMLRKMRGRLARVREQALTDLAVLYGDVPDARRDELFAARTAARNLLADTFAISNGRTAAGEEAPPTYVAHHELLATDLALRPGTLLPDQGLTPDCLTALLRVAGAPPADPQTVYAYRDGRGDHDLTAVLITGVRATDPRTAIALERLRNTGVGETAIAVAGEVNALIRAIDAQRMTGGLDDGPYSALSSRAQDLHRPGRTDFGRIRDEATAIGGDLKMQLQKKVDHTVARITRRAADDPAVAEIADDLIGFARVGQIASAEEYLEQGTLPRTANRTDHLGQFFPAVPDLYAAVADLGDQLRDALAGHAAASPAVRELAGYARTDLTTLSQERRAAGVRALNSFAALFPRRRDKPVEIRGALRQVLAEAGLEFSDATVAPEVRGAAGRRWVTLTGVSGLGEALVPLLGSAMSPDGGTLRVLVVTNAPSPATVLEWASAQHGGDTTVLAVWTGRPLTGPQRRAIADAARGRSTPPVLFLDAAALGYLACQSEPRRATFGAISLPMTAVSPFRDTPGDTAPEMFYGRATEMQAVLDLTGPSVLYGGRQLGKSALLRAAAAEFEKMGEGRVAVLESIFTVGSEETRRDAGRLWEVLWPLLARRSIVPPSIPTGTGTADAVYSHVLEWTRVDPRHALLILLDEADVFLDADAVGNRFTQVDWCRRIMLDSGRRVKFVFAGLHRTARFESLPNQPLSHLGRPLSIGPLRPQHAHDLLTEPLSAMGFRFDDLTAGPARVLALANNMPALLQLFGRALMAHLTARPVDPDGPPSLITADDIETVFADADLRDAFRDKYQLTIRLDHRYMVIAYVLAEAAYDRGIDASLSLTELLESCRQAWPAGFADMHTDVFRGLVTECVDLSVLAEDNDRYRIRTPTVLRLLGTEEHVLDVLYTRTNDMSVPSPTDASSYRSRLSSGNQRSPFTQRQLGQLLAPNNRVWVVTGSAALGIDKAATALEEAAEKAQGRIDAVRRVPTVTPDGIRRDLGNVVARRRTLLIANALRLSPDALAELLDVARAEMKAAASRDRQVCLAVIAGPVNAARWVSWPDRVELGRVDLPGLRLWMEEAGLPFHDDETLAALRDATGGWPSVIARVETLQNSDRPVETAQRLLDEVGGYLAGHGAVDLAQATDLHSGALAEVFTAVAGLTAGEAEDLDSLAELLDIDDGLNRDAVAAAGITDLVDAVIALQALGCLTGDVEGGLRAEPVLARALATAHRRDTTGDATGAPLQRRA